MFDWSEYLYLAQHLNDEKHDNYGEEAKRRSAISRAYYAAFCTARNYLIADEGAQFNRDGTEHKAVRDFFRNSGPGGTVRRRDIFEKLRNLHRARKLADYEDSLAGGFSSLCEKALIEADDVIATIAIIRKRS